VPALCFQCVHTHENPLSVVVKIVGALAIPSPNVFLTVHELRVSGALSVHSSLQMSASDANGSVLCYSEQMKRSEYKQGRMN
jgi:hypothetical protein